MNRPNLTFDEIILWMLVLVEFVMGDTITTWIGLSRGLSEAHPISKELLGFGITGILFAKLVVLVIGFGLFVFLPRLIPGEDHENYRGVIPLTLAGLGLAYSVWNLEAIGGLFDPMRDLAWYLEVASTQIGPAVIASLTIVSVLVLLVTSWNTYKIAR